MKACEEPTRLRRSVKAREEPTRLRRSVKALEEPTRLRRSVKAREEPTRLRLSVKARGQDFGCAQGGAVRSEGSLKIRACARRRRCGGEGIHSVRESAREAGGDFDCIETDGARRGRSMEIRAGRQRGDEEIHELATKALTNDWGSGQPIMRAFSEHKAGGESTAEMR